MSSSDSNKTAPSESTIAEIVSQAKVAWRLFLDPKVPAAVKLIPVAALVYLISPIDLIPDIPVLGQIDDLVVILLALRLFVNMAPKGSATPPREPDDLTTTYRVEPD